MNLIIDVKEKDFSNFDKNYISLIENKILFDEFLSFEETKYFLDYLIFEIKKRINNNNIYDSKIVQAIISHYLNDLKCPNFPNQTNEVITNNIIGHSFISLILKVENQLKAFLIDPLYINFFTKERCNSDFYYIYKNLILRTPDPGFFIKKDDLNIVKPFLANGYGELNENFARIYGDSFLNTKNTVLISEGENKTINGKYYINSFLKTSKFPLIKTKEELENDNLLIKPVQKMM